ncbi:MAG: hypothetical protein ACK44H_09645, partial [Candidatus Kryptonium sp.]
NGSIHRIDISPGILAHEFNDIRLAQRLRASWRGEIKILKLELTKTKSTVFTEIIETLYKNNDLTDTEDLVSISPDGSITVQVKNAPSVIVKSITEKNYIIFIDDLESASSQMIEFIVNLVRSAQTIIATTSGTQTTKKAVKHLLSQFEKIELKEFDKQTTQEMTEYITQKYLPHAPKNITTFLKNEAERISKGNPTIIKALFAQAIAQKHLTEEEIRKLRTLEELEYINLGPFIAILLGSITIIKILQIGLEERETFILLSILSFTAYLIIRIFRYFLLFRPQRKK